MDGFAGSIINPNFVETHDVGNAGKRLEEFFRSSRDLAGLKPYGKYVGGNQWASEPAIRTARLNYILGRATEEILPRKVVRAIENISSETSPPILHIKGLPAGVNGGHIPETGFAVSALVVRGISALTLKGRENWENAVYASNFQFDSTSSTKLQEMHSDFADDTDVPAYQIDRPITEQVYSFLHYTKTNGLTPTWFCPYNSDDARKFPEESRHIPVVASSGDLLMFKNRWLLHARGESPKIGPNGEPVSPDRHFVGININKFKYLARMPKEALAEVPGLPARKAALAEAVM